jgi:hypothetical protein
MTKIVRFRDRQYTLHIGGMFVMKGSFYDCNRRLLDEYAKDRALVHVVIARAEQGA